MEGEEEIDIADRNPELRKIGGYRPSEERDMDKGVRSSASAAHSQVNNNSLQASKSNTGGTCGSDDDPGVMDERKQKRMLSNRESARRSRLRKQQHVDDLKGQVSQLRSENIEMVNRFNIASQHYSQLTEENRTLRAYAMELSKRLQRLHHAAAAQGHPLGHELGLGLGLGSGHPGALGDHISGGAMSLGLSGGPSLHAHPSSLHHPQSSLSSQSPPLPPGSALALGSVAAGPMHALPHPYHGGSLLEPSSLSHHMASSAGLLPPGHPAGGHVGGLKQMGSHPLGMGLHLSSTPPVSSTPPPGLGLGIGLGSGLGMGTPQNLSSLHTLYSYGSSAGSNNGYIHAAGLTAHTH